MTDEERVHQEVKMAIVAYEAGNYKEALRKFRRIAEQGDARAQYFLGLAHTEGVGVSQDEREAAYWWRKAAEQGFALAQYHLGVTYREGQGVEGNMQTAYQWFLLAAVQGDEQARQAISKLGRRLTAKKIAAARASAAEWQLGFDARQKVRPIPTQ